MLDAGDENPPKIELFPREIEEEFPFPIAPAGPKGEKKNRKWEKRWEEKKNEEEREKRQ